MGIATEKKIIQSDSPYLDEKIKKVVKKLTDIQQGSIVRVVKVEAGQDAKTRLNHLGITPNVILKLECSAPFHGPVCLKVRGTQLCVGRGLAEKVLVEMVDQSQCEDIF